MFAGDWPIMFLLANWLLFMRQIGSWCAHITITLMQTSHYCCYNTPPVLFTRVYKAKWIYNWKHNTTFRKYEMWQFSFQPWAYFLMKNGQKRRVYINNNKYHISVNRNCKANIIIVQMSKQYFDWSAVGSVSMSEWLVSVLAVIILGNETWLGKDAGIAATGWRSVY